MTFQDESDHIGVSDSTIRNWNRLGISEAEYAGKLTTRANKRKSEKVFKPQEYAPDSNQLTVIDTVLRYAAQHRFMPSAVLFLTAASLVRDSMNKPLLAEEITSWEEEIDIPYINDHKKRFDRIVATNMPGDFLGLLYQSLLSEGKKATSGSYYTPQSVARGMLEPYCKPESTVLDPACGTGQFLLEAAHYVKHPHCLYGIDNDPTAVRIARINLMMRFPEIVFQPNIFLADTLSDFNPDSLLNEKSADIPLDFFDLVVTNPPWGSHGTKREKQTLAKHYPQIRSGESFSCFLVQATRFAKKGGVISFLLPESILNIKVHSDIRDYLSKNCQIQSRQNLGRLFTGVFTPVVRLDVVNDKPCPNDKTDSVFTVFQSEDDRRLIHKIEACPTWHLKENAKFALGIVTGNNERHLMKTPLPGSEPIYRGKEVTPFFLKQNAEYIVFQPEQYQQVAPVQLYRAEEKLIYRFISQDLVFAYDTGQRLTLNSANMMIPTRADYSVKVLCAVLNSELMRYVYRKKFNTLKVLRGNLEELPIPDFSPAEQNNILALTEEYLATKHSRVIYEMNRVIYRYFEICKNEVRYISGELKQSSRSRQIFQHADDTDHSD